MERNPFDRIGEKYLDVHKKLRDAESFFKLFRGHYVVCSNALNALIVVGEMGSIPLSYFQSVFLENSSIAYISASLMAEALRNSGRNPRIAYDLMADLDCLDREYKRIISQT